MCIPGLEKQENEDLKEMDECEEIEDSFESSFEYHAVPLDEQMTLDENGTPFTLQELMNLKELREELDEKTNA